MQAPEDMAVVVDMAALADMLALEEPEDMAVVVVEPTASLAVLDQGRIALLVVSDAAVEGEAAVCPMWVRVRAATRRKRHTRMSGMEEILVGRGEISLA